MVNMKNYARIIDGLAVNVSSDPENSFHPDIAREFVEVPSEVDIGWILKNGVWSAPIPAPAPPPALLYPTVGVSHFKMLFTSKERVKVRQLRPADEILDEFWSLVDDQRTVEINMALMSIQEMVEYTLDCVKAAGVVIDVPTRKAAILSGVLV